MVSKPHIKVGKASIDDRGKVSYVNAFDPLVLGIRRVYTVENHRQGFIRAWHGHEHEDKWVTVVTGAALICAAVLVREDTDRYGICGQWSPSSATHRMVVSASEPAFVHIPAGHANGFMSLTQDAKLMFFSNKPLEDAAGDDIRLPWDYWNLWEIEQR
jgi:dTDP-4-dehydrorhamnose 3,5-epimerase-like enzyme